MKHPPDHERRHISAKTPGPDYFRGGSLVPGDPGGNGTFGSRWRHEGGHTIVTVGADGAARLWDGETGQLLNTYRSTSRYLVDAMVASDGSMVIAGGSDGLLWFWERESERPLWTLQAHHSDVIGIHFEGDQMVTRGFAGDVSRWNLPKPAQVIEATPQNR